MPQGPNGYVPIDATSKQLILQYLENLIRQGAAVDQATVDKAGIRFGQSANLDNSDNLAIFGLARQAKRAVDAASGLNANPSQPPTPSQVPNVPSDPANRGQYVYDVLITASDPATGDVWVIRTEIVSPTPMSANDIDRTVNANRSMWLKQTWSTRANRSPSGNIDLNTTILDVGRGA